MANDEDDFLAGIPEWKEFPEKNFLNIKAFSPSFLDLSAIPRRDWGKDSDLPEVVAVAGHSPAEQWGNQFIRKGGAQTCQA